MNKHSEIKKASALPQALWLVARSENKSALKFGLNFLRLFFFRAVLHSQQNRGEGTETSHTSHIGTVSLIINSGDFREMETYVFFLNPLPSSEFCSQRQRWFGKTNTVEKKGSCVRHLRKGKHSCLQESWQYLLSARTDEECFPFVKNSSLTVLRYSPRTWILSSRASWMSGGAKETCLMGTYLSEVMRQVRYEEEK